MKSIYLPALESVVIDDIESFLGWLGQQPTGRISLAKLQRTTQVRATKLGPLLKLLQQFAFLRQEQDAVTATPSGLKFSRAGQEARKVMLKNQFVTAWPMHGILEALDSSGTGSLGKNEIIHFLKLEASMQVTEQMAEGVMAWGRYCELFFYDEEKQEISRITVGPKFPSPPDLSPLRQGA